MTALQVSQPLVSFLGDPAVKDKYLNRVRAHRAADEIIHGSYWEERDGTFKGCAVGCTLHNPSGLHHAYETELGIPVQLAWIQDGLFERLTRPDDVMFPEQFLDAIPVGVNLYPAYWRFVKWTLDNEECGLIMLSPQEEAKTAFKKVADYYQMAIDGVEIDQDEFNEFINARARDLALDLDLDLARALDLDLDLDLALDLDLDLARALDLDLDLPLLWRDELLKCLREAK